MTIVISSNMQKTEFQTVKFLSGILVLTLILSSTSLSSKTFSDFKLVIQKMALNVPAQYFNLCLQRCSLVLYNVSAYRL